MTALAIGLLWAGYSLGLYGYVLVAGRDLTPAMLLAPGLPAGVDWYQEALGTVVIPDGKTSTLPGHGKIVS